MPTNKELEQRIKKVEKKLSQPAETPEPDSKQDMDSRDLFALLDALKKDNETYGKLLAELADSVVGLQHIVKIAFTLGGQYHEPFPGERGMAQAQKRLRRLMEELPSLAETLKGD